MASSSMIRFAKSETRNLADVDRASLNRLGEPTEWEMTSSMFFHAFVAICALLAVFALVMYVTR